MIFVDGKVGEVKTLLASWAARIVRLTRLAQPISGFLNRVGYVSRHGLECEVAAATASLRTANRKLQAELAGHKLAELALRESEADVREILDSVPVGIWMTNAERHVSFLNKTALIFLGGSSEGLVRNNWTELIHFEDVGRVLAMYSSAVDRRCTFRIECRVRRADGQYRWMLNTGLPRSAGDVYIGHVGTMIDLTGLKRSYEQMFAAQKLESLSVLAAGIAHDFNNILGAVFADCDLALSEIPHNPLAAESISRIKAVAVRASEIVKLLQTYACCASVSMEDLDFSQTVEDVIQHVQGSISRKATLSVSLARGLPQLRANREQIRLVVSNLIVNASEALEDGEGSIGIATGQVHLSETMARTYGAGLAPGHYLRLTVQDTGCGMYEAAHMKIFDPFYSTKFLGRGLGLAVVQGILRSHRGGIGLLTAPGSGARFEILLPCSDDHSNCCQEADLPVTVIDRSPDSVPALSRS